MSRSPRRYRSPQTASEMLALFTPLGSNRGSRSHEELSENLPTAKRTPSLEVPITPTTSACRATQSPFCGAADDLSSSPPSSFSKVQGSPGLASNTEGDTDLSPRQVDSVSTLSEPVVYGRFLRPRSSLTKPSHLSDYVEYIPKQPKPRPSPSPKPPKTATSTKVDDSSRLRRDNYLLANRDLFESLLPSENYIKSISEQRRNTTESDCHVIPYKHIECQPEGVNATLKQYQLEGLSFLLHMHDNCMACILGDEMGLGKTLQVLSLFQFIRENGDHLSGADRPFLVICPLSVLDHWVQEARKFTPKLDPMSFYGSVEIKDIKRLASKRRSGSETCSRTSALSLIVTTYEKFVAEKTWFKRTMSWQYVVLDEGHRIKNDTTNVAKSLQSLKADYRLILTGTPLQNDLHEMWALLHWLYPEVFTDRTEEIFRTSFDLSRGKVSTTVLGNARQLLELIMLRRMKDSPGVDLGLPPKHEIQLFVPLTPLQKYWYTRLLTGMDNNLLEDVFRNVRKKEKAVHLDDKLSSEQGQIVGNPKPQNEAEPADHWRETEEIMRGQIELDNKTNCYAGTQNSLLNLILQLRKCCNHPYLFPEATPEPYHEGEHIIQASGKMIVLAKLIEEFVLRLGRKILVFSGMTGMLNICEDLLEMLSQHTRLFNYAKLDGSTCTARRNLYVRLFNDSASKYQVLLVSIKAGGLGLNLAAASEVVFLDEDWNPQLTLQAEARAHRIGQTKPVTVYKLCAQGTVEEQMLGRIRKKLYLSAKITESMESVHTNSPKKSTDQIGPDEESDDLDSLESSQLKSLLRRSAQTLSHPQVDVNEMLAWDWNTILEKCKDRSTDPTTADTLGGTNVDEQAWLSSMERVECAVFDGKTYKRKHVDTDPLLDIIGPTKKRDRKERTTEVETEIGTVAVYRENLDAGVDRTTSSTQTKKPEFSNQSFCQSCWTDAEEALCFRCPRSYHYSCLSDDYRTRASSKRPFICPQHSCYVCGKTASQAGQMLYRCRWCDCAYCEGCLDFDRADLVGDELPELQHLDFDATSQAFFIRCPVCRDHHRASDGARSFFRTKEIEFSRLAEFPLPIVVEDADMTETEQNPLDPTALQDSRLSESTSREVTEVQTSPKNEDPSGPAKGKLESTIIDLEDHLEPSKTMLPT